MTDQVPEAGRSPKRKRPMKAFIFSFIGGLLIFLAGASRIVAQMFAFTSVLRP